MWHHQGSTQINRVFLLQKGLFQGKYFSHCSHWERHGLSCMWGGNLQVLSSQSQAWQVVWKSWEQFHSCSLVFQWWFQQKMLCGQGNPYLEQPHACPVTFSGAHMSQKVEVMCQQDLKSLRTPPVSNGGTCRVLLNLLRNAVHDEIQ